MKEISKVTLFAVGAALLGAGLFASVAASAEPAKAPKSKRFGCVDIMRILHDYKKSSQIQEDEQAQLQAAYQKVQKKLDDLRRQNAQLDLLVQGSPAYKRAKAKIDKQVYDERYDFTQKRADIAQAAVKKLSLVYTQVRQVIANYAKQHGLTCVFVSGAQPSKFPSFEDLQAFISAETVIYRDDSLDITDVILNILNK